MRSPALELLVGAVREPPLQRLGTPGPSHVPPNAPNPQLVIARPDARSGRGNPTNRSTVPHALAAVSVFTCPLRFVREGEGASGNIDPVRPCTPPYGVSRARFSRSEFVITVTELIAIAAPASIGFRKP